MIVAGIASLPGRPLERVVRSLRPQVDEIFVWLNGYPSVPEYLRELKCTFWWSKTNDGSSKKFWGAPVKCCDSSYYFACDDDLEYPPDYVGRMLDEFALWGNRIFVTACGRTLKPNAKGWRDWTGDPRYVSAVPQAKWINYLGGCAFAFHTSLALPKIDPPNEEEAILSVWAQREQIPIRLIKRPYDWPKRIPLEPGSFTLYEDAVKDRFETRSRIIQRVSPWTVHVPLAEAAVA